LRERGERKERWRGWEGERESGGEERREEICRRGERRGHKRRGWRGARRRDRGEKNAFDINKKIPQRICFIPQFQF
jgi:hypothetical protein